MPSGRKLHALDAPLNEAVRQLLGNDGYAGYVNDHGEALYGRRLLGNDGYSGYVNDHGEGLYGR